MDGGRETELAWLNERLVTGRSVVITGEAGIGKTWLLQTAIASLGPLAYVGGALAMLSSRSYLPLGRAIGRMPGPGDHQAVAEFVFETVGDGLLAIDDLQWSDADTLKVLSLISGELRCLYTVRTGDPGEQSAIESVGAMVDEMALGPLSPAHANELLDEMRPGLSSGERSAVLEAAGGSPLLLEELSAGRGGAKNLKMRTSMMLSRLSDEARLSAIRGALLRRPASEDLLGPGLAELKRSGLVTTSSAGVKIRFDLLAAAITEDLGNDERRALHRELAEQLIDPGEAAGHWLEAGIHSEGRECALAAAAVAVHESEKARYLALAASCTEGEEGDQLKVTAAEALNRAGRRPESLDLLAGVKPLDDALAARVCLERAAALGALARLQEMDGEVEQGLTRAAAVDGEDSHRLEIELRTARLRWRLPSQWADPGLIRYGEELMSLAESHRMVGADLLRCQATIHYVTGRPDLAVEQCERALPLALEEGRQDLAFDVAGLLLPLYQAIGSWRDAKELSQRMAAQAERLGLAARAAEMRLPVAIYQAYQVDRDFTGVIERADLYLNRPWLLGASIETVIYYAALSRAVTGDLAGASRLLDKAEVEGEQAQAFMLAARAEVEWLARRPEASLKQANLSLETSGASPNRYIPEMARAWAQVELGIEPTEPQPTPGWPKLEEALAAEFAGLTAMHEGQAEPARTNLKRAAELWQDWEPVSALRCRWAAADLAADECAEAEGGRDAAATELVDLEQELEGLGMIPLLGRVRSSLTRLGIRRSSPRGPRIGELTARQAEVMALVADGLSSNEIAGQLGIAKATVDVLARRATRQLGARNRREAALIATRMQAATTDPDGSEASRKRAMSVKR